MNQTPHKIELPSFERELLKYIDRVGYTSPVILRCRFKRSRQTINRAVDRLYLASRIARPMQGLIVSLAWADKHPHEKAAIEAALNIHIA